MQFTSYYELENAFRQGYENLQNIQLTEEDISQVDFSGQQRIDESMSVAWIIGIILGAPAVLKKIVQGIGFVVKKVRKIMKKEEEESEIIQKMIEFAEKWINVYVSIIKKVLAVTGIFKKAGVEKDESKRKIAEAVYYLAIFGLAVNGGIASAKSITTMVQHANTEHLSSALIETVLTAVKSGEIKDFLSNF